MPVCCAISGGRMITLAAANFACSLSQRTVDDLLDSEVERFDFSTK
jgi:hypothetical protein